MSYATALLHYDDGAIFDECLINANRKLTRNFAAAFLARRAGFGYI
jgi:hypothetical protein